MTILPPKNIEYYFNYADFMLEGYNGDKRDSSQLIKAVIATLNDPKFPKDKKSIDRHKNRTNTEKRLLVHISAPFEKEGKRSFGKIALIKNKSVFWLSLSEAELIEEIAKPGNKEFAELTNYSITFDPKPIIMVEFNSAGPRLSDIEYFFRQVAKDAHIAKSVKTRLHLSVDYNELNKDIKNVFNVEVKMTAGDVYQSGDVEWHEGLKKLSNDLRYKDVRLEFTYPRIKDSKPGKYKENVTGLKLARNILSWLKKKPENIENVADLKMQYLVEGSDELISMDFIKNKTTSILPIPIENVNNRKEFNYAVGIEFNKYLTTGKTTPDKKE